MPTEPPDLGGDLHPPGPDDAHKYPHESHPDHRLQGDHADQHLPDDHREEGGDYVGGPAGGADADAGENGGREGVGMGRGEVGAMGNGVGELGWGYEDERGLERAGRLGVK